MISGEISIYSCFYKLGEPKMPRIKVHEGLLGFTDRVRCKPFWKNGGSLFGDMWPKAKSKNDLTGQTERISLSRLFPGILSQ